MKARVKPIMRKNGEFIVKVQRPIFSSGKPAYLAYNEKRDVLVEIPFTKELHRKMGDEYKLFFYARLEDDKMVLLGKAPWQNW